MQRSFILGCCPLCDRYKRRLKSTRRGHRKYRKIQDALHRKFRRVNADRLRHDEYELVALSEERWF